jgi:large subunit ribosomal protein L9e
MRRKKNYSGTNPADYSFFSLFTVKVHIRSRVVTVEGPRGKLVKDLSHIAVTFGRPEKDVISIELHHGARKGVATLRTVRTIINNLIIGVTRGFLYKMRYVYAHFPINVNIEKNAETGGTDIEIRNFLGEKYVRRVSARPGVDIITSANVKDELQLSGNSLEDVSQSAADIQQICRVRNKDIRKVSFKNAPLPLVYAKKTSIDQVDILSTTNAFADSFFLSSSWTVCTCLSVPTSLRSKCALNGVRVSGRSFLF